MEYPHHRSTNLMKSCAKAFHVDVGTPDVQNWSAGFTMAKALDTLVDEDHVYETGAYTDCLLAGEHVAHLSPDESTFVRETFHGLDEAAQERWRHAGAQLGSFALRRLAANTIDEYAAVVFDESQLMSDVMKVQNCDTRHDFTQRETFNTWMDQMSRTAFIYDTISDFIRDHNEGNVNIAPTLRGTLALSRYAIREFVEFSRVTPAPVYAAIAHRSATKTIEKVRQPGFLSHQFMRSRAE